jgi:proline iminopeptidase
MAALVPHGTFSTVPGVPHDFWYTHPEVWTETITKACTGA